MKLLILLLLAFVLSCSKSKEKQSQHFPEEGHNNKIKVEVTVQYIKGCIDSKEMIKRVEEAIKDIPEVKYTKMLIETEEKAREVGFRGSPTLLINGKDYEGLPVPEEPTIACRVYSKGLPSVEDIRKRIENEILAGK
jgi:hypothetical protein